MKGPGARLIPLHWSGQVVAYGISINLVEVTWKSKIKAQFPNPNDYSAFMGDFSTATGAVTFAMMILSRFIFRRFGWGGAAQITPTVLLVTGKVLHSIWHVCVVCCSVHILLGEVFILIPLCLARLSERSIRRCAGFFRLTEH